MSIVQAEVTPSNGARPPLPPVPDERLPPCPACGHRQAYEPKTDRSGWQACCPQCCEAGPEEPPAPAKPATPLRDLFPYINEAPSSALLTRPLTSAELKVRTKVFNESTVLADGLEVLDSLYDLGMLIEAFQFRNTTRTIPVALAAAGQDERLTRRENNVSRQILSAVELLKSAVFVAEAMLEEHLEREIELVETPAPRGEEADAPVHVG